MPLKKGTTLGDYTIVRPLGRGGMGDVYLGHDAALDRSVAIKTILAPDHGDEDVLRRFQQEAQSAARLIHPSIVQVFKVDLECTPPYMAMEYVDGRTLEQLIKSDGALTWQRALTVCGQVASALACAHDQNIVHRDIKPGNIMVDTKGRVRVTDFGLAKMLDSSLKMTRDNQSIGSPFYMSPEHWGEGEIGPSSDLFSLGITLFELITGRLPFEAKSAQEMMMKITTKPLPPLAAYAPGTPKAVQMFVETLAARDPLKRYETAHQVLEDLQSIKNKQPPVHMQRLLRSAGTPVPDSGTGDFAITTPYEPVSAFHKPIIADNYEESPTWIKPAVIGGIVAVAVVAGLWMFGGSSGAGQRTPQQVGAQPPPAPPESANQSPQGTAPSPPPNMQPGMGPNGSDQMPMMRRNMQQPGFRRNVQPPQLNVDFKILADGRMVDARTGQSLETTENQGQKVPGIRTPAGFVMPAGKTADGRWVPLGPPPPRRSPE
jgi:serine/threonine protein kinase